MSTLNTGTHSPESAPQSVSAIPGLGKKIMTALAALGIAVSAEKVEGAVIVLNGLSPSSTVSGPVLQSGSATEALILNSGLPQNSRLFDGNSVNGSATAISRFTITLSPTDVVGSGGILTLTGNLELSTQPSATMDGQGSVVGGSSYSVNQQVQWGKNGNPMTPLASINSPILNNADAGEELSTGEKWYSGLTPFSVNIPITSPGTYYLDNVLTRNNVSGGAALSNFTMTYAPIPEPSTGLIAGGLLGAALLRRRRENQEKQ